MIVSLLLLLAVSATEQRGLDAFARGDAPGALVQLSLALRECRNAADLPCEARVLSELGRVHRALGRYQDALRDHADAAALSRKAGDRIAEAADRMEEGLTREALYDAKKAGAAYLDAAKLYQEGGDVAGTADALTRLAFTEADLGRPGDATRDLDEALRLYLAAGDTRGAADVTMASGVLSMRAGNFAGARSLLLSAEERYAAIPDREGQGAALLNLASLSLRIGDYGAGEAQLLRARPLLSPHDRVVGERLLGDLLLAAGRVDDAVATWEAVLAAASPSERPGVLLDLASAARRGDRGLAERRYDEAAAAAAQAGDDAVRAAALLGGGELRLARDPRGAASLLDESVALCRRQGDGDRLWRALFAAGRAAKALGRDPLPLLREAGGIAERARAGLDAIDPEAARIYVRARKELFEELVAASLAAGDSAGALLWSERIARAELRQLATGSVSPEEGAAALLAERAAALERAQADAAGEQKAALEAELAAARKEFSRYVDALRTERPDFDRLAAVDPRDLEEWQRSLQPGDAVLQPILLEDRVVLLVFTDGPLRAFEAPVPRDEVLTRLSRFLKTVREQRLSNPQRLIEHLDVLGNALLVPALSALADARRLLVAPSGPLRYLPFAALRAEGRYLTERWDVLVLPSVGSLHEAPPMRPRGEDVLAIANPDGTLPAADAEADAIAALLPAARVLRREQATRDALRDEAVGRAVLHLATHGVLDALHPERSYLVLAGGGAQASAGSDGRLGYLDIPALAPSMRSAGLVALSACETAVPLAPGDGAVGRTETIAPDGLEIAGLAQQFRRAGVPRLLASLWPVSDASTKTLMTAFYEGLLAGRDPAASLAAAQRRLLADPATAHPFHWAAFTLIGAR